MAIVINYAGASLVKPGAYSRVIVAQSGAAQAQLGIVALIGEASAGAAFSAETGASAVAWSPAQFNQIAAKYGSGQLVDAARLVFSPSNDPQILGGAQILYTLKTNQSTTASLTMASSYGTISALNPGAAGNNISVAIAQNAGQDIITITDTNSGTSVVSSAIGNDAALQIQVTAGGASAATLTITASTISTTITGTGAANLSIPVGRFPTLAQLASFIAAQPGYTCTVQNNHGFEPPSVLDQVTAVNIKTAPYSVLQDAFDISQFLNNNGLVSFVAGSGGHAGIPASLVTTFLSGGALGATSQANIQACLDALSGTRVNFVVPLFSQDATADITAGNTDAGSTYTIASTIAALNTHCLQNSTVKGRNERQGYAGFMGTYANAKSQAAATGSARVSIQFQQVDISDASGNIYLAQPHMLAVCNAGMKAAAVVGLPNTFKLVNINGFDTPSHDFNPNTQADDAINANLTFVEAAPGGGFRFVLDNSTYGQVTNAWIYNRPAVLYAADTLAFSIRLNMETFVGQRNSDISPETVKNLLLSVLDGARASGILVPDTSTGGKGFTNLAVTFAGNVVKTSVTVTLVEGIEFVLNDIQVQRAVF
jgi:hypothetical protein